MAFVVKTIMNIILQELQGEGYPSMILPWERRMEDTHTTARMGGGVIPPDSNNVQIDFPGITTLTTVWFCPDVTVTLTMGAANAEPIEVQAGGCFGFTHAMIPASDALRVTYGGDDPGEYCVVYAGE